MKIQDNILKFYLKNCYFITGTAYAGKSTMVQHVIKKVQHAALRRKLQHGHNLVRC